MLAPFWNCYFIAEIFFVCSLFETVFLFLPSIVKIIIAFKMRNVNVFHDETKSPVREVLSVVIIRPLVPKIRFRGLTGLGK